MNKSKNKRGISLIVLVITIIVMIILAATIILSIKDSGIIEKAKEAKNKTDIAAAKELGEIAIAEWEMLPRSEQKDRYGKVSNYVKEKLENAGINPDDYVINENGKVEVGVAKIGEIKYATLNEAVESIKDNTQTTITIINNNHLTETVEIGEEKNIIIDLNGYIISSNCDAINNEGVLKIKDSSKEKTGSINAVSDKSKYEKRCDLNNDGVVGKEDVDFVIRNLDKVIDESTSEEIKKCDFNGDNVVQLEDFNYVLHKKNHAYALYFSYGTLSIEGISQDKISGEPSAIYEEDGVKVEWK